MSYFKKLKEREVEVFNKETIDDVKKYASVDAPERGIRKATLERFGVKVALSEKDGRTPEAFYFPSYNQKGKIVGYTKQDVTKGKDEKGHWSAIGLSLIHI